MDRKAPIFATMGCRLNAYETEAMKDLATRAGVPWTVLVFGNLGIALLAGAAAVVNHVVDQKIDTVMARTRKRPVATGRIATLDALLFATVLAALGMVVATELPMEMIPSLLCPQCMVIWRPPLWGSAALPNMLSMTSWVFMPLTSTAPRLRA